MESMEPGRAPEHPLRRLPPHGGGGKRGCIKAHEPNTCYTIHGWGGRYTKVDCTRHECALCEECAKQQGAFGCGSQGEQACSKEEAERAKASLWGQYPDPPPPPPPSVPPSPPPPPPPSPPPPAPSPPDIFSVGDVDSFRDAAGIAATPAPPRGCRFAECWSPPPSPPPPPLLFSPPPPDAWLPSRPPAPSSPSLVPHLRTHLTANHRLATQISLGLAGVVLLAVCCTRSFAKPSGDDAADAGGAALEEGGGRRVAAEPRRPTTKKKGRGRYESVAVEPAVEPAAAPPPPKAKPKRKKEKEKRGRGASRAAASEVSELLDQD